MTKWKVRLLPCPQVWPKFGTGQVITGYLVRVQARAHRFFFYGSGSWNFLGNGVQAGI